LNRSENKAATHENYDLKLKQKSILDSIWPADELACGQMASWTFLPCLL